jgi:hypothetical protein
MTDSRRRALNHPPAAVARIGELSVAASGIHFHSVFKALRVCEDSLRRIISGAAPGDETMPEPLSADQFLELLRGATEDDIDAALEGALFDMPINNTAELLEVFNRVLDVLTGEADAAHSMDRARIASAAARKSGSD